MKDILARRKPLIVAGFLLLLAIVLFSIQKSTHAPNNLVEGAFLELLGPLSRVGVQVERGLRGFWQTYIAVIGTGRENRILRSENHRLSEELESMLELGRENERLRRLLDLPNPPAFRKIVAGITARDSSNWSATVFVNRGSRADVHIRCPVISDQGVVGQIVRCWPHKSEVQVILDTESGISCLFPEHRVASVITGTGERHARLVEAKYISQSEPIELGERVVSSGLDGIFPKGILIGTVKRIDRIPFQLFQTIFVETAVDFSHLEEVVILIPLNFSTSRSSSPDPMAVAGMEVPGEE